jgi:hypothetical protein
MVPAKKSKANTVLQLPEVTTAIANLMHTAFELEFRPFQKQPLYHIRVDGTVGSSCHSRGN